MNLGIFTAVTDEQIRPALLARAVDSPPDVMMTLQPMNIQSAAADLLPSRACSPASRPIPSLSDGPLPTCCRRRRGHC